MKRVMLRVKMPVTLAGHFAKFTFENGIVVILSYTTDEFFDGVRINAFVAAEEGAVTDAFTKEFANHIVK